MKETTFTMLIPNLEEFTRTWYDLFTARRHAVKACDWNKVGRIDDKLDELFSKRTKDNERNNT